MARNKQNQKQKKDGNHRKESKEEKRLRIQAQKEAQEYCEKILPMVAGCIVLLFIVFGIFVQLTPPKEVAPKASIIPENIPLNKNGVPDFMDPTLTANKEPVGAEDAMLKEALDEAAEALKVAAASEGNGEETIEL